MSYPDPATTDWVPLWSAGPIAGYVPAARVYHNAAQSIPSNTTTLLAFNSERFDTDNIHDTVTNNSRLTCKTAGLYQITANIDWASTPGNNTQLAILLNGTTLIALTTVSANVPTYITTTLYNLAVNDYVEVRAYQNTGAAVNINVSANYSPEFSMTYIGPNVALGAVMPVNYGTTLPAAPADGQEAILVDSITNPSYQWRFRYNAGSSSAYKWEFVGGAPKVQNFDQGSVVMNNAAFTTASGWYWWVNAQGVFPVPRSGDYDVLCKMSVTNTGGANQYIVIQAAAFGPSIGLSTGGQSGHVALAGGQLALMSAGRVASAIAGTHSLGIGWTAATVGAVTIQGVWVEITPVRVS